MGAPMLLGSAVRQAWLNAAQEGMADQDHTALINLLERRMGAEGQSRPQESNPPG
jgi:hypothetical protein